MRRLLTILLTLLGFAGFTTSCEVGMVEYGSPSADFELKGMVTDVNDDPVEGIRVSLEWEGDYFHIGDTDEPVAFTDSEGRYRLHGWGHSVPDSFLVEFDDIDGEENGGEFRSTVSVVGVAASDFKGGGDWYRGKATKTLDIKLKLKAEE